MTAPARAKLPHQPGEAAAGGVNYALLPSMTQQRWSHTYLKCNLEFQDMFQEELACWIFLRGLRALHLRGHTRLAAPLSLMEALQEVEHAEPILVELH